MDEYKEIILSSLITQNSIGHFERISSLEHLKNNLTGIYDEFPSNFQFSTDNGYSTDENTTFLKKNA